MEKRDAARGSGRDRDGDVAIFVAKLMRRPEGS
jgi:hypothetical protein